MPKFWKRSNSAHEKLDRDSLTNIPGKNLKVSDMKQQQQQQQQQQQFRYDLIMFLNLKINSFS